MNYTESLEYLEALNTFGIEMGLERIKKLMDYLDKPNTRYKTIHITGTNGKGSTSMLLSNILRMSGIKVGLFTSPHLISYTERMQIDGCKISEEEFAKCIDAVSVFVEKMATEDNMHLTQFEVLTAAAFLYFAINHVDYAVIEVGLGGKLDSTNVVKPEVAIITNVSMDHMEYCGNTLEDIALHKAGIIKTGVPVITAAEGKALEIIREKAEEKNADLFIYNEDFSVKELEFNEGGQTLEFISELVGQDFIYKLQLLGTHQWENSALAIMCSNILANGEDNITKEAILDGLYMTKWQSRFEYFNLDKKEIIIDGAHNPAGIKALKDNLDKYFPSKEKVYLLGILKDKDIDAMLSNLLSKGDEEIIITMPNSTRAAEPDILKEKINSQNIHIVKDIKEALDRGLALVSEEKLLCITGSLYLTGEIRHLLADKMAKKEVD